MKAQFKRDVNGMYLEINPETNQDRIQINELTAFESRTRVVAVSAGEGIKVTKRRYIGPDDWDTIKLVIDQLLYKTEKQGFFLARSKYSKRLVVIAASLWKKGVESSAMLSECGGGLKVYSIEEGQVPETFTVEGSGASYDETSLLLSITFDDSENTVLKLRKSRYVQTFPELLEVFGIK